MPGYTLRIVALGGAVLGALSGILGSFAVLRRQSLIGDALSHAALPGIGIAFLIAGRSLEHLLLGAGIASILGVGFIFLISKMTRIKEDSAMGIVLSGWFATGLGILAFIQQRQDSSQAGLNNFIFGQAAAMIQRDLQLLIVVSIIILVLLVINWKELKLITFNREFARSIGIQVNAMTFLLMAMIVITVVMGLQLAGVILMVGLLIAPGIAARQWTDRLEGMVVLSGIIGAVSGAIGSLLSALDSDIPTGPMIILTVSLFVLISILFAPGRGIVLLKIRQQRDRMRFAAERVRKAAWNYVLSHAGNPREPSRSECKKPVSESFLVGLLGRSARHGIRQLLENAELEQLEGLNGGYILTAKGLIQVRSQELGSQEPDSQEVAPRASNSQEPDSKTSNSQGGAGDV